MKRFVLVVAALVAGIQSAAAWGPAGQKAVNQLAIYGLPSGMQPFYYHFRQQLVDRALEPDTRVKSDPREAARHHIDIDHYGLKTFLAMPQDWEAASGKYSADTLYAHGMGPWAVMEAFDNLTQAFRDASPDNIVKYSVELANYMGDMNLPMHTSAKYDPAPNSLTTMWETRLVEPNMGRFKLYDGEAKALKETLVGPYVWAIVRESYGLTEPVLGLETDVSREVGPKDKYAYTYRLGKATRVYSDKFADAYFGKVGGMVAARLRSSADAVATLWLTAWDVAGKPNLAKMLSEELPKEEKTELARDLKLRKDFNLVPEGRLLALVKPATKALKEGEAPPEEVLNPAADSTAAPAMPEKGKGKKDKKKKDKDAEKEPAAEPDKSNFSPSDK